MKRTLLALAMLSALGAACSSAPKDESSSTNEAICAPDPDCDPSDLLPGHRCPCVPIPRPVPPPCETLVAADVTAPNDPSQFFTTDASYATRACPYYVLDTSQVSYDLYSPYSWVSLASLASIHDAATCNSTQLVAKYYARASATDTWQYAGTMTRSAFWRTYSNECSFDSTSVPWPAGDTTMRMATQAYSVAADGTKTYVGIMSANHWEPPIP